MTVEDGDGETLRVVLLGPPGAGKGTQAGRIADAWGIPHIATGDIFRANVRNSTELGREAEAYMDEGELVPDEITVAMVRGRLQEDDVDGGFILDGFPRTVPQAQSLEELLADLDMPLDVALRFAVDEEDVVRRITGRRVCRECGATYHVEHAPPRERGVCDRCGGELVHRDDDREEVVRNRIAVYHRQTEPLEFFYWQRGLLRDVDATGGFDEVEDRARDVLSEYAAPRDAADTGA